MFAMLKEEYLMEVGLYALLATLAVARVIA